MDISIFPKQDNAPEIISKDSGVDKFQKIMGILCDKRKKLEESITIPNRTNNELEQNLEELKEEMKTFGISELDYQKYLVTQADSNK